MSIKLNKKHFLLYDFIKSQVNKKGYPPVVREMAPVIGAKSTSTVHRYLKDLEDMNMLKINSNKSRAIEILGDIEDGENERETINIPIVGTIAAGIPILAVENIEDTISIPMDFIKHKEQLFILKVKGESMIDAGILDEDFAIIEKSDDAENGDIVAVLIGNEATLKRFYKEKDYIRLQPENKTMEPIIVKNCRVMGKLVAVYRGY